MDLYFWMGLELLFGIGIGYILANPELLNVFGCLNYVGSIPLHLIDIVWGFDEYYLNQE